MPKLQPKDIQKELDQGKLRAFYWLTGAERMKVRELSKRIRAAVLKKNGQKESEEAGWNQSLLDGSEMSGIQIVDEAQSLSFGGGIKLLIISNADQIKDPEALEALFTPDELFAVCILTSIKDLDMRKKFSKKLIDHAAVVPCEEVLDHEREAWVGYLAKRRALQLTPTQVAQLRALDPWSLEIIDQELEKFEIALQSSISPEEAAEVFLGGSSKKGTDYFVEAFFRRKKKPALESLQSFIHQPSDALPLLGLMGWYTRQLALLIKDQKDRTHSLKLNSFVAERMGRWASLWSEQEVSSLQSRLSQLDFDSKQTRKQALGLWGELVQRFTQV